MGRGGIRRSGISAPGPSSGGWITQHRQLNPRVYEIGASPDLASRRCVGSCLPENVGVSRIVTLSAVAVTLGAWAAAVLDVFWVVNVTLQQQQHVGSAAALAYVVLITVLVAGSLTYLSARYGYARRLSTRQPASDSELDAFRMTVVPSVTILVPSYKEDPALVWKTLLSAALQDYPRRSIVLLIDDPPIAATHEDARALGEMRELADAVERRLAAVHARVRSAAAAFERRADRARLRLSGEARELAGLYQEVAAWFAGEASRHRIVDHTDRVFVEVTLLGESRRYRPRP